MAETDYALDHISVALIDPNPENPRGKNVRDNDPSFEQLKQSIELYGLIVPLIVQKTSKGRFVLLDGERRYLALRELGSEKAPAHILSQKHDSRKTMNLMFHIHSNRSEWGAREQCQALEIYYEELSRKYNNDRMILKELVELVGGNERTLEQRLTFLKWPEDIKRIVYNDKPDLFWTVVEIENGIMIPAQKNFPEYFERVDSNDVRQTLFDKYLKGYVKAATEVRKVRPIVRTPKEKRTQHARARETLDRLLNDESYTFDDAKEDFLAEFPAAEEELVKSRAKLIRALIKLYNLLRNFDFSSFVHADPDESKRLRDAWVELVEEQKKIKADNIEVLGGRGND